MDEEVHCGKRRQSRAWKVLRGGTHGRPSPPGAPCLRHELPRSEGRKSRASEELGYAWEVLRTFVRSMSETEYRTARMGMSRLSTLRLRSGDDQRWSTKPCESESIRSTYMMRDSSASSTALDPSRSRSSEGRTPSAWVNDGLSSSNELGAIVVEAGWIMRRESCSGRGVMGTPQLDRGAPRPQGSPGRRQDPASTSQGVLESRPEKSNKQPFCSRTPTGRRSENRLCGYFRSSPERVWADVEGLGYRVASPSPLNAQHRPGKC